MLRIKVIVVLNMWYDNDDVIVINFKLNVVKFLNKMGVVI